MSCRARISHLDGTSLYGSLETVPENDQIVHACFAGCAVSAMMTQLCHCSVPEALAVCK